MKVCGLNHFNVATGDLETSAQFYEQLGLARVHRPGFPTTGIWMGAEPHGAPIIHLNDEREVGPILKGTSAFHHVGLSVRGQSHEVKQMLDNIAIRYSDGYNVAGINPSVYFNGPSGECIELVMVDVVCQEHAPLARSGETIANTLTFV